LPPKGGPRQAARLVAWHELISILVRAERCRSRMKDLLEVFTESSSLCRRRRLGQQLPAGFWCSTAEKRNSGANRLIRIENKFLSGWQSHAFAANYGSLNRGDSRPTPTSRARPVVWAKSELNSSDLQPGVFGSRCWFPKRAMDASDPCSLAQIFRVDSIQFIRASV